MALPGWGQVALSGNRSVNGGNESEATDQIWYSVSALPVVATRSSPADSGQNDWTTLEMACCDALDVDKLGGTFLEALNNELENCGKSRLDLGSGLWQQINTTVRSNRKTYSHFGVKSDEERIPPVSVAEEAIRWIRLAIEDIYIRMGKDCPKWIMTDHVAGWPERRRIGITNAALSAIEPGANPYSPDVIKLTLVRDDGKEDDYRYFPPNTPNAVLDNWVEDILTGELLNFPYTKVRVYRGPEFVDHEFEVR